MYISIHAPHEGERPFTQSAYKVQILFQSTLPTRGSDLLGRLRPPLDYDFNPRSPRGGATFTGIDSAQSWHISIHAPHEGERRRQTEKSNRKRDFNPRSPRGGATVRRKETSRRETISIHAPHEGERLYTYVKGFCRFFISIHAPHEGERPSQNEYRG